MIFLTSILDKYFNESLTIEEYYEIFLKLGYEVENYYSLENSKDVVVAKTLECKKHPNADNLSLCKVSYDSQICDVVCGGLNVKTDQWVAYAPIGSTVGNLKLAKKNIRGIDSSGMILSISELVNISKKNLEPNNEKNILELSSNKNFINTNMDEYKYENNLSGYVFDLSILSDRMYAANHSIMAKEIAAFKNLEYKQFLSYMSDTSLEPSISHENISLGPEVKSFYFSIINFIKHNKTPNYIKNVLYSSNIKVTNTIEDVLNFIFIINGVSFYLTEKSKTLGMINENLIVNGQKHNIYTSSNILLSLDQDIEEKELSLIAFSTTLKTNISTVKNINPLHGARNLKHQPTSQIIKQSYKQLIKILLKHNYIDYYSKLDVIKNPNNLSDVNKIKIDNKYLRQLIDFNFDLERVLKISRNLDFNVESQDQSFIFEIPEYRNDIKRRPDIIEEFIRIIGTENIVNKENIVKNPNEFVESQKNQLIENVNQFLINFKLNEVKTYHLISEDDNKNFNIFNKNNFYVLKPEFKIETNNYRNSLLSSLLEVYKNNYRKYEAENLSINIFEISNISIIGETKIHLGILIDDLMIDLKNPTLFLKAIFDHIYKNFNISQKPLEIKFSQYENLETKIFVPNNTIQLNLDEKAIGYLGELHLDILRKLKLIRLDKIKRRLFYLEFELDNLIDE